MATTTTSKSGKKTTPPSTDWRVAFLNSINAPVTASNLSFLDLWEAHEGGIPINNPLNTSLPASGSGVSINSSGVKKFSTLLSGAKAAGETVLGNKANGTQGYGNILQLLRKGNAPPAALAVAVERSPWDGGYITRQTDKTKGHYGGFNAQGQYVGGSLFRDAAHLSKNGAKSPSFLGEFVHEATKTPGQVAKDDLGAGKTVASNAVGGIWGSVGGYVVSLGAVGLGGAMALVGIILIGADIGLASKDHRAVKPVVKVGGNAVSRFRGPSDEEKEQAALSSLEREERANKISRRKTRENEKIKQEKHKTTIQREKAKTAKARNKPIGGELPAGY